MIALLAIVTLLLLAVGAFVGANFCEPGGGAQQALLGLGGALVGMILPSVPAFLQRLIGQTGFSSDNVTHISTTGPGGAAAILILGLVVSGAAGCHNTKPDEMLGATVDCAKVNPENSAALGAVTECLIGVVMQNYGACISGLVVGAKYEDPEIEKKVKVRWTIDEVACVTAWVAQRENQKVAITAAGPASLEVRNRAINWIVDRNISYRNTYAGAP